MRDDNDYSGSEDEERTREDTGGQQRHPGETRCEEFAAGDVIGALEKGEVEYRYGVRRHDKHEDEDSGWVHTEARVTTHEIALRVGTLGTSEQLLGGGYYVALAVQEDDEAAVQEQPEQVVEDSLQTAAKQAAAKWATAKEAAPKQAAAKEAAVKQTAVQQAAAKEAAAQQAAAKEAAAQEAAAKLAAAKARTAVWVQAVRRIQAAVAGRLARQA